MEAYDVQLTDTHDLLIVSGDFVVDISDERHIQHILIAEKGGFKASPMVGIGIGSSINAPADALSIQALRQRIQLQLQYDGYENVAFQLGISQDGLNLKIDETTTRKPFQ